MPDPISSFFLSDPIAFNKKQKFTGSDESCTKKMKHDHDVPAGAESQ